MPDETFLTEHQITESNGIKVSTESGHPVEWFSEENYVFRMAEFTEPIRNWLDNKNVIVLISNDRKICKFSTSRSY